MLVPCPWERHINPMLQLRAIPSPQWFLHYTLLVLTWFNSPDPQAHTLRAYQSELYVSFEVTPYRVSPPLMLITMQAQFPTSTHRRLTTLPPSSWLTTCIPPKLGVNLKLPIIILRQASTATLFSSFRSHFTYRSTSLRSFPSYHDWYIVL